MTLEGSTLKASPFRQPWAVAACVGLAVAFIFWWRGRASEAFVAATLGVVAYFLNLRGQLQRRNLEADAERARDEGEEEFDEDDAEETL
jgi:hypothetical protein